MKITTRILIGFGILILAMIALTVYQGIIINRLQGIDSSRSQADFRFALGCLDLIRDIGKVEEYLGKYEARPGPDALKVLRESVGDFENSLTDTQGLAEASKELEEMKRLAEFWRSFRADLIREEQGSLDAPGAIPAGLQDHLDRLRAQSLTVYEVAWHAIAADSEASTRLARNAVLISWSALAIAVVLGALASFLIFRSISIPLAHLQEGTSAIASGKYFYRLDTSRKDELSRLARDFNALTERMAELDQMKRAFVSHVSHELKAPMASMRETLQLLLEGIPGPLTDKQRRLLELGLQSGSRLSSMLANLLDLSKIEAGVMEYDVQTHDLVPLVKTAIAGLEAQAREKKIRVDTDLPSTPLPVECDRDRIVQVIGNVITNAIKFSPAANAVTVSAGLISGIPEQIPGSWRLSLADLPAGGGLVLLSISDAGPGVPDEQKERIFEKFVQVRQGKKMPGQGLGLGLAICRTIIEAHGGAIWMEDRSQGGSVVKILLHPGKPPE